MKNRGDLALVSREYFGFGLELLAEIRKVFSQTSIKELGTSCAHKFQLTSNDQLKQSFMLCRNPNSGTLTAAMRSMIYDVIIKKAFHARIGAETAIFKDENTSTEARIKGYYKVSSSTMG